jgi:hypothetical protein
VEVRKQRIGAQELEAGSDEQFGAAGERPAPRQRLEDAHSRRSHSDDPRRVLYPVPGRGRDPIGLAVQPVLRQILDRDGAKRVEADVQRHPLDLKTRK